MIAADNHNKVILLEITRKKSCKRKIKLGIKVVPKLNLHLILTKNQFLDELTLD